MHRLGPTVRLLQECRPHCGASGKRDKEESRPTQPFAVEEEEAYGHSSYLMKDPNSRDVSLFWDFYVSIKSIDLQESLHGAIRVRFLCDAGAYNGTRISWLGVDCGRMQYMLTNDKSWNYIHRQYFHRDIAVLAT